MHPGHLPGGRDLRLDAVKTRSNSAIAFSRLDQGGEDRLGIALIVRPFDRLRLCGARWITMLVTPAVRNAMKEMPSTISMPPMTCPTGSWARHLRSRQS